MRSSFDLNEVRNVKIYFLDMSQGDTPYTMTAFKGDSP